MLLCFSGTVINGSIFSLQIGHVHFTVVSGDGESSFNGFRVIFGAATWSRNI